MIEQKYAVRVPLWWTRGETKRGAGNWPGALIWDKNIPSAGNKEVVFWV